MTRTMDALIGFTMAVLLGMASWYGYSVSLTLEGFILKGYIGASVPALLGVSAWCLGAAFASNR